LRSYWNFERRDRYGLVPFLTTNFHDAHHGHYERLSERAARIEAECPHDVHVRGRRLKEAALAEGIGFSIGLSPWTDCSLERTWKPEKDRLVIILAHDWYPITVQRGDKAHPVDIPLRPCGLEAQVNGTPKYHYATPPAVLAREPVVLFMNLVPDYRPAGARTTGKLDGYAEWLEGFDAVLESAARRYRDIKIVSWGNHVWCALRTRVRQPVQRLGIMQVGRQRQGEPLAYMADAGVFDYLPVAHPSDRRNFDPVHTRQGHASLGLD
jgi:hypothetical protein